MGFLAKLLMKMLFPEALLEQDQVDKCWHGVSLHDLNQLAKDTRYGTKVEVDEYDFLVFYYTSKSGKKIFPQQCELDDNKQLVRLSANYYPGQLHDSADGFVEKANQLFIFQ